MFLVHLLSPSLLFLQLFSIKVDIFPANWSQGGIYGNTHHIFYVEWQNLVSHFFEFLTSIHILYQEDKAHLPMYIKNSVRAGA